MDTLETLKAAANKAVENEHGKDAFMGSSAFENYAYTRNAYIDAHMIAYPESTIPRPQAFLEAIARLEEK